MSTQDPFDTIPNPGQAGRNEQEPAELKLHRDKPHNQRDFLSDVAWALILIWAGLVFLANNLGWLVGWQLPQSVMPKGLEALSLGTWSLIFLGAGVILLLEGLLKLLIPSRRSGMGGAFLTGFIFLGITLSNLYDWDVIFPLVLIGLGLTALLSALTRER